VGGAYKATFTTTALSRGVHSITARFVGIGTYKISASDILSQTIV
jgi:hypothetical protein